MIFILAFSVAGCGRKLNSSLSTSQSNAYGIDCVGETIEDRLKSCIEGLEILKVENAGDNGINITMTLEQPVDHFSPKSSKFKQLLHLNYRNDSAPMVLVTTGYSMYSTTRKEPSIILNANQLTIEHRYFGVSKPVDLDWSKLNVKQSAYDFHQVTIAFKKIFKGSWINTGASKGGMTSVYHRHHFPNDLDGTVAYVAPMSFSDQDGRYNDFLDQVGGQTYLQCRGDLLRFQREIINRKDKLAPFLKGNYTKFAGGKIGAIEVASSEIRFTFWQYGKPQDCELLKLQEVDDQQFFDTFAKISKIEDSYNDETLDFFASYYFQSATELGGPAIDRKNIEDIVSFPENLSFKPYLPAGSGEYQYSNKTMLDVASWVDQNSEKIMYIYGEFDPWSAGKFDLGQSTQRDSLVFTAPAGNHGAKIAGLVDSEKLQAISKLKKWANVSEFNGLDTLDLDLTGSESEAVETERYGLRP